MSTVASSAELHWWPKISRASGAQRAPPAERKRKQMQTLVLLVHVLCAVGIVVLVLLQHGKGADMGAAFGSGSAGSLFGSAGAANFLSRTTAILAAIFFVTSLGLTYFSAPSKSGGVTQHLDVPASKTEATPAAPAPSAPAPTGDVDKSSQIPK
jgi:preprotein translocase subunit SecG